VEEDEPEGAAGSGEENKESGELTCARVPALSERSSNAIISLAL
jgi:hypothetical protein